jgi:hypothetical protein
MTKDPPKGTSELFPYSLRILDGAPGVALIVFEKFKMSVHHLQEELCLGFCE